MLQVACSSLALVEFRHCDFSVFISGHDLHPHSAHFSLLHCNKQRPIVSPSDWHSPLLSLKYGGWGQEAEGGPSRDLDMTKPGFSFVYFHHALIQKLEALVKENIGEWGEKICKWHSR